MVPGVATQPAHPRSVNKQEERERGRCGESRNLDLLGVLIVPYLDDRLFSLSATLHDDLRLLGHHVKDH